MPEAAVVQMPGASPDASIDFEFAEDVRHFRLPINQLVALQTSRNAGPFQILRRLLDGTWHVEDVQEVLRLGLIGGGTSPMEAKRLVERFVIDGLWAKNSEAAWVVLSAALFGKADDPVGKAMEAAMASPTPASGSPSSSGSVP